MELIAPVTVTVPKLKLAAWILGTEKLTKLNGAPVWASLSWIAPLTAVFPVKEEIQRLFPPLEMEIFVAVGLTVTVLVEIAVLAIAAPTPKEVNSSPIVPVPGAVIELPDALTVVILLPLNLV